MSIQFTKSMTVAQATPIVLPLPVDGDERFRALLTARLSLSAAALDRAERAAKDTDARLPATLVALGFLSDVACADALAAAYALPRAIPEDWPQAPVLPDRLPLRFLARHRVAPLTIEQGAFRLAVVDPGETFSVRAAELAVGIPAQLAVATGAEIDAVLRRLYDSDAPAEDADALSAGGASAPDDVELLRDMASDAPVVRLVNGLLARAVERNASDIHLESTGDGLRVRLRVHGKLSDIDAPPPALKAAILSRLKLLAGMDIAEYRLPQDGRIKTVVRGRTIDLRVASLPTPSGETMAIRVLDRAAVKFDFRTLGFDAAAIADFRELVRHDHGIVLVTGPTGSGKTTTLYTAVEDINSDSLKIITVEDPVEYQFDGVVQVQVRADIGLDFASVLRATLRHNPDVLLVGEIRDRETAQVAIQAALTGHLVLSTVHTNSAASTVTRLVDMGVDPYLVAATLHGVLSQRLVPLLCPNCRIADAEGSAALRAMAPELDGWIAHRPVGCNACNDSGYVGRTVVHEMFKVTPAMREAIGQGRFDALETLTPGFRPIQAAALAKVASGACALGDVLRATHLTI